MPKILLSISVLLFSLITFLFANFSQIKPVHAAACSLGSSSVAAGGPLGFGYDGFTAGQKIFIWDGGSIRYDLGTTLTGPQLVSFTIPSSTPPKSGYGGFIENGSSPAVVCGSLTVTAGGTSGGSTSLGTITPPAGIPNPADATEYTAGFVRNAISLLIVVAFIAMLLWTIFAGFRFVTSGGDSKTVGQAWSSIYWGIIGMIVVVGSYAIVKLVETFFGVSILSGGLVLP